MGIIINYLGSNLRLKKVFSPSGRQVSKTRRAWIETNGG